MILLKISHKYDKLYKKAKAIMNRYNPCKFNVETSLCISNALRKKRKEEYQTCGCCGNENGYISNERCKHFKEGIGCSVKSLGCKIWLCADAENNLSQKVLRKLEKIYSDATAHYIYRIRFSKEEALDNERFSSTQYGEIVV